ncbi:MAG: hypothetical protein O2923_09325 [Verrucomicrobia bacterium]|nr:hypothetical protein [Verrucomicrobiota bacterium]MDA1086450.1 hypothetical protein [Verrucomicrobiota bacterium]
MKISCPSVLTCIAVPVLTVLLMAGCVDHAARFTELTLPDDVMAAITAGKVQSCKLDHRQNVWRLEMVALLDDGSTKGYIASFHSAAIDNFKALCDKHGVQYTLTIKE